MNNMEGSVFCPAWLVPQVADNELPNMIYSTGEFTMKHMLPVKKDEGLQLEEKVVKVIFPMLVASEDVACRRAVFKNENGDALTKMCRGLLYLACTTYMSALKGMRGMCAKIKELYLYVICL